MKIRLQITGGFAGPAAWQDLAIDDSHPQFQQLLAAFQAETNRSEAEAPRSPASSMPDGQTYQLELMDEGKSAQAIIAVDGKISDEVKQMINVMKQSGRSNAEKEQDEDEKGRLQE